MDNMTSKKKKNLIWFQEPKEGKKEFPWNKEPSENIKLTANL